MTTPCFLRPRLVLVLTALAVRPAVGWAQDEDDDDIDFEDENESREKEKKKGGKKGEDDPKPKTSDDEDPEWDTEEDVPDDARESDDPEENLESDPDEGVPDGPTARRKAPPPPEAAPVMPDVHDKTALADNFPIEMLGKDLDAVVIELPVLVARNRSDFKSGDFWVIGEVMVDGKEVAEMRQLVTAASVAELGPTFVWIKAEAPVNNPRGVIEVRVSRQAPAAEKPAAAGAVAAPPPEATVLFTKWGEYRL